MTDLDYSTCEPEHDIGTEFRGPAGDVWKYDRIVFFIASSEEVWRYIWLPWNNMAKLFDEHGYRPDYVKPGVVV